MKEVKLNYHSFIGDLSKMFDPIILKMRQQDPSKWRREAWLLPLRTYLSVFRTAGVLSKIGWGSLPIIGPALIVGAGYIVSLPAWIIGVSTLLIVATVYWLMVSRCVKQMATLGHPHFHIGAFQEKRPTEYQLWAPFLKYTATFEGLFNFLTPLFNLQNGEDMKGLVEFTRGRIEAVESEKEEYKSARDFLQREVERYEKGLTYLVDVIKKINLSLYRMANDCMNFYELDFVCAYTIYQVEGDTIRKIVDKGTSGASPDVISLTKENADKYAAVYVAMLPEEEDAFSYNNPFPGRTVASYRMKVMDETWIWNFHFDDSDDKALQLTLSNDIIEVREIYRLVHAFCIIVKREIEGKGGTHYGNTASKAKEN